MNACRQCGGPIPATSRADAVYCGDACKSAAYRQRRRQVESAIADSDPIFGQLQRAVDEATEEVRLVARVAAEARTNWRAAAWLLERRHPERWATPQRAVREVVREPDEFDDVFREVTELAEVRRRRERPEGY